MSTPKKSTPTKPQSADKKPSNSVIMKRGISKEENETLVALVDLITAAKTPVKFSILANNLSKLSEENHKVIGKGQKALHKFLSKHGDVFIINQDTVWIHQNTNNSNSTANSESSLQQVECTVDIIRNGFGFLSAPNGSSIYFGANVFEGGLTQELPKIIQVGDRVLVDAVKGDPNFNTDWQATKVTRSNKRNPRSESVKNAWSGSSSSLDSFNLPWDNPAITPRNTSCESLSSVTNKKKTQVHASDEKMNPIKRDIIKYMSERIEAKGSLTLKTLAGHLSALDAGPRHYVGSRLEDLRKFVVENYKYFNLDGDVVSLTNDKIPEENDNEDDAVADKTNSGKIPFKTLSNIRGVVIDSSSVRLSNNDLASYLGDNSSPKLSKDDVITCDVAKITEDSEIPWKILKITDVKSATPAQSKKSNENKIEGYIGKVIRLFPTYGFVKHGNGDDENIYFHKDTVLCANKNIDVLTKMLVEGDEVLCDAQLVSDTHCKYKALRIVPLKKMKSTLVRPTTSSTIISSLEPISPPPSEKDCRTSSSSSLQWDENEGCGSDDDWDTENKSEQLYNCSGPIISLFPTTGFIQRGKLGKDPENVYFNTDVFFLGNQRKVTNLMEYLKINDVVHYDALRGPKNASCRWKATYVWSENTSKISTTTLRTLNKKEGHIIKLSSTQGLIAFGPNPYQDRVFFSVDVFYYCGHKVNSLMRYLKNGDVVCFSAKINEKENRTRWMANIVWTGDEPQNVPTAEINNGMDIVNGQGKISKVQSRKGVISVVNKLCHDEVYFDIDVFYDNGETTADLEWCLKVNDTVSFDAFKFVSGKKVSWKAVLVWKGKKPNVVTKLDKMRSLKERLDENNPLASWSLNQSAPVVNVGSESAAKQPVKAWSNLFKSAEKDEGNKQMSQDDSLVIKRGIFTPDDLNPPDLERNNFDFKPNYDFLTPSTKTLESISTSTEGDNMILGGIGEICRLDESKGDIRATMNDDRFSNRQVIIVTFYFDRVYINGLEANKSDLSIGQQFSFDAQRQVDGSWIAVRLWKGHKQSYFSFIKGMQNRLGNLQNSVPLSPTTPTPTLVPKNINNISIHTGTNRQSSQSAASILKSPECDVEITDIFTDELIDKIEFLEDKAVAEDTKLERVVLPNGKELIPWDEQERGSSGEEFKCKSSLNQNPFVNLKSLWNPNSEISARMLPPSNAKGNGIDTVSLNDIPLVNTPMSESFPVNFSDLWSNPYGVSGSSFSLREEMTLLQREWVLCFQKMELIRKKSMDCMRRMITDEMRAEKNKRDSSSLKLNHIHVSTQTALTGETFGSNVYSEH